MKKGNILTFGQLRELCKTEGNIVHLMYFDDGENPNPCFDDFGELTCNEDITEGYVDLYGFPLDYYKDNELVKDIDNCGWKFTVCGIR